VKWLLVLLLIVPLVHAKAYSAYPPPFGVEEVRERLLLPHIYPGQTIVSSSRFLEDPLRRGSSTVRWTSYGSYGIRIDRVHLRRNSYTVKIKSKQGTDIRQLPFETTKLYLPPDYYSFRYDPTTYIVWISKYPDYSK